MRGLLTTRRTSRTRRPELLLAPGPAHLGQPGAGTFAELYGHPWALALYRDGPQLLQQVGDSWEPREDPGALAALVRGVRHVTLAWDQAARPVVAWELDGAVYVRQWSPEAHAYITRGPWPGRDPLLYADSLGHMQPSESDVVLWYLTPDRHSLAYRVQRDLYAVQRIAHTWAGPMVLDQLTTHPYRVQLIAADVDDQAQPVTVGLYPVHVYDATSAQAAPPTGGELFEIVMVRTATDATSAQATAPTAGELFEVVMVRTVSDALTSSATAPAAGELLAVVLLRSDSDALTTSTSAPAAGSLDVLVVTHTQPADAVSAGVSAPTGGTLT